jgi:hypothetical protein
VHADRRLLKILTPVLRPAPRWNYSWAVARAIDGLEPCGGRRALEIEVDPRDLQRLTRASAAAISGFPQR